MKRIWFHKEETPFYIRERTKLRTWLTQTAKTEGKTIAELNIVLCSDTYLHKMNVEYLNHDTLTDIITFDYSENETISGDIFISIDRTRENALKFAVSHRNELHRVIIHGLLHLIGYGDKTKANQIEMKAKEDYYLSLRNF